MQGSSFPSLQYCSAEGRWSRLSFTSVEWRSCSEGLLPRMLPHTVGAASPCASHSTICSLPALAQDSIRCGVSSESQRERTRTHTHYTRCTSWISSNCFQIPALITLSQWRVPGNIDTTTPPDPRAVGSMQPVTVQMLHCSILFCLFFLLVFCWHVSLAVQLRENML